jgi:hypothetical protein
MVFGSFVFAVVRRILTTICRGALYVKPTVPGSYNLIPGGEVDGEQIQKAITAGPKFVQLYDWSHFPSEYLIEEWDKA